MPVKGFFNGLLAHARGPLRFSAVILDAMYCCVNTQKGRKSFLLYCVVLSILAARMVYHFARGGVSNARHGRTEARPEARQGDPQAAEPFREAAECVDTGGAARRARPDAGAHPAAAHHRGHHRPGRVPEPGRTLAAGEGGRPMSRGPGRWQKALSNGLALHPFFRLHDLGLPDRSAYTAALRAAKALERAGKLIILRLWNDAHAAVVTCVCRPDLTVNGRPARELSVERVPGVTGSTFKGSIRHIAAFHRLSPTQVWRD